MMNQKISEQNWSSVKGDIQKSFSNLSAEELESTHGDTSLLTDLVVQKAGIDQDDAEKKLDEIVARYRNEADETTTASFSEEDEFEFEDYVSDADDERFGADEGLTSPSSRSLNAGSHKISTDSTDGRSDERIPRPDIKKTSQATSSSEFSTERKSPDTNPTSNPKKKDQNI